ncbi:MAG: hypothetical protein WAU69_05735 [Solirubrobacteraceae bacterium]
MTTTAQITFPCSRTRFWLALASVLALSVICAVPVAQATATVSEPPPSGHPGYWAQTVCSEGSEAFPTDGWRTESLGGYPTLVGNLNTCGSEAGSLSLKDEGSFDSQPDSGPEFVYETPVASTISGGSLKVRVRTPGGKAYITTNAFKTPAEWLLDCTTECASGVTRTVAITQKGGWLLFAALGCIPPSGETVCASDLNAELEIRSATIMLRNESTPTATGFGGTLLDGAINGTASVVFEAHDKEGPGVYRVTAELDGKVFWSGTPSLNEGRCVAHGSYEGALTFRFLQPCPQEVPVSIEVPASGIASGEHQLILTVEDAAGNTAKVYNGTITVANLEGASSPQVVSVPAPPDRGACNGTPCDEAAKLIASARESKAFTRAFGHSTVALTGRLTSLTGAPIKSAQVKLLQQIVGSTAMTAVASTTTRADGSWSFKAPAGPSRLLRVAFYSHTLDTLPASVLDFHESVQGAVSMHAPRRAPLGRAVVFTGQLAGGYVPATGESVQMEIFYSGRWRTIEVLPTTSKGRWTYKYVFSLGVGTSYLFRAATVPNGGYPYMSTYSKPVRVTVQR